MAYLSQILSFFRHFSAKSLPEFFINFLERGLSMPKGPIHVIDEIMGNGKTSAMINYMNSYPEKKYIYLSPNLKELERIKNHCAGLRFKEPSCNHGSKSINFSYLLERKENIVATHQLFFRQLEDVAEKYSGYTLIIDEAPNSVVADFDDKYHGDYNALFNDFLKFDNDYRASWITDPGGEAYRGAFSELKEYCDIGYVRGVENGKEKCLFKVFPAEFFEPFEDIFILTFLFKFQMAYAYFISEGFSFDRYYVTETPDSYLLTDISQPRKYIDLASKVELISGKKNKLYEVGSGKSALSKTWYSNGRNCNRMRCKLRNFFDCTGSKANDRFWTVYSGQKEKISGTRYNSSFLSCNAKSTNDYADRHVVAYLINLYFRPTISKYFKHYDVAICDNGFALSEMIQFIFRSAIRKGERIQLYIPSPRMRRLFLAFMDFASGKTDYIEGIDVDIYDWNSAEN